MDANRKILIVDDAPMFRELASLFLARSGRVITASGAVEGLELARRERPDVIVTDLDMPGMGGDELCRAIKHDEELAEIPVIVVAGRDEGREHAKAVRAGADDVVEKPLNRLSLIQSVNHFLRIAIRGLERVPLETDVDLAMPAVATRGRSRNVSRGGIFVETEASCPDPETPVRLSFELQEGDSRLDPTARVVWRRLASAGLPPGMGLQFLELDREAARRLDEYVYERAIPNPEEPPPSS